MLNQDVREAMMSGDDMLERLAVFLVSVSLVGVVLALSGYFIAPLVVAIAALCTWTYHVRVPASPHPPQPASRLLHALPVLLLALCFRLLPFDYVMGGQDQGLYTNMAAELVRTHDIAVTDPELDRLAGTRALPRYRQENYIDPFLPGVYTSKDPGQQLTFQFYHVFPVWLALFAGLFGASAATYALTFLSLVSILFFQRLAAQLTGSARLGTAAGLLLALNPLHAFFSKFPVTEIPTLAFSTIGFAFLSIYSGTDPGIRARRWLWLSALAFGCLFLTRISGFMYLPLIVALGIVPLVTDKDRDRAIGLSCWALATTALYAASVAYGLLWSRPYSETIYADSFSRIGGSQWPAMLLVLGLAVAAAWWLAWRRPDGVGRVVAWLVPWLPRVLGIGLLLVLVAGAFRIHAFAFTDAYNANASVSLFPALAAQGWPSVARSSLLVVAMHLSPWLFLVFVVLAQFRWNAAGSFLVFFLCCFVAYAALLNWFVPYQPYYARYFASELVPYALLLVVCALGWIKSARGRQLTTGLVALAGLYFLVLSVGQLGKREDDGARESIARLADLADDGDVILLDETAGPGLQPRAAKTTLVYMFGRHVISTKPESLGDTTYLAGISDAYDDVFLATPSGQVPTGFERVDAFRLHATGFERSASPPWRVATTLDANLFVYRLQPTDHGVGSKQDFMMASDARIGSQVGQRDPLRGLVADGRAGFLVFGPYLALEPGAYQVEIWGRQPMTAGNAARLDVASGKGLRVLASTDAQWQEKPGAALLGTLEFDIAEPGVADLEVRVAVGEESRAEVSHFTLLRLR